MIKGKRVNLDVYGKTIEKVIIDERGRLFPRYGEKGRPTERFLERQVRTKTLQRSLWLNEIFRKSELDPARISQSLMADIVHAWIGGNRQTDMDYAKTLIALYAPLDRITHRPRIKEIEV